MEPKIRLFLLLWISSSFVWAQPQPPSSLLPAPKTEELVSPEARISKIQKFLSPFNYDRDRFRDPFEPQTSSAPLKAGEVYGPFLNSQSFRLSDFELKGLVWNTDRPVALFRAPNGKRFRLGVKDFIGENFGYIASIRENEVVVIQTVEEGNQRYSTTKVVFLQR